MKSAPTLRRGVEAFAEQLVSIGVRHVFGNPGTTEQAFIDHLQDVDELDLVLALHEGVAVGAAEGYARASGEPAFVLLHTAAGLGNAMGMLANASLGQTPMVVYVGDMPRSGLFQEPTLSGPIVAMADSVARWAHEVRCADELPQVLRRAFKVAAQDPPGPVVLSIPCDVMEELTAAPILGASYITGDLWPDPQLVAQAARALGGAQRPAILVGDGIPRAGGQESVARLADLVGAPVHHGYVTEVCMPPNHPLDAGPLPLFAPGRVSQVLSRYDCVLAVGTEVLKQAFPGAGLPLPEETTIIHVHTDPHELSKNQPALNVQGNPRVVVEQLAAVLSPTIDSDVTSRRREETVARLAGDREAFLRAVPDEKTATVLHPAHVAAAVAECLPDHAIIVDESVSAQPWIAQALSPGPGSWFRSRGGGLGAGMSMAPGVQLAVGDRPVVALVGDGSAMYTLTSLWTAAHHRLPVTFVILDNAAYAMLKVNVDQYRKAEGQDGGRPYVAMDLVDPELDFVSLARGLGVDAVRVCSAAELRDALTSAIAADVPILIDVVVGRSLP
ncbi:thiamine pyrophosphate-binding protein [Nocardioides sp.]|uniref:thiamine pyrophosphate-binding protein n=1 Tax=Nocardioides sp. TaxID=35761 RepID=UPI003D0B8F73